MRWSDVTRPPSSRTLRQFAGGCLACSAAVLGLQLLAREPKLVVALAALGGLALGVLGLIRPRLLRWVFLTALVLTFPIGWVTTQVVLALLFFGILTPLALVFRISGRDVLQRQAQPERPTYWAPKSMSPDAQSYFRQF